MTYSSLATVGQSYNRPTLACDLDSNFWHKFGHMSELRSPATTATITAICSVLQSHDCVLQHWRLKLLLFLAKPCPQWAIYCWTDCPEIFGMHPKEPEQLQIQSIPQFIGCSYNPSPDFLTLPRCPSIKDRVSGKKKICFWTDSGVLHQVCHPVCQFSSATLRNYQPILALHIV